MLQAKLSPSMMCVDFAKLSETVNSFEEAGIDYLHVDIMDGEFVPNFTLGVDFCNKLRVMTNIPLDIHLMIEKPENKLSWFNPQPGEYIAVHTESTAHLQRALTTIRAHGAKAMAAINPATPISALEDVLDDLDGILVMTVNPGFAGQKLVPSTLHKIKRLRSYLDERGYSGVEIEVDGNVSFDNAVKMRQAGANIFVGGSSSIFSSKNTLNQNIQTMLQIVNEEVL